jgi:hypothetical protein
MVYLIHFEIKFKHCQHYIGFSGSKSLFKKRIAHHLANSGSRLLRAVNLAGIAWSVVRTWDDMDGNFERQLKKRKNASRLCPICKQLKKDKKKNENKSKKI